MGKLVANIDDDVKARAAALYDSMGMSLSTAVNMFLRQSLVDNGLPFRPTRHTPGRLSGAACSQCIHVRAFGEGPCDTARRLG